MLRRYTVLALTSLLLIGGVTTVVLIRTAEAQETVPVTERIPNPPQERLKDFAIVENQGVWHVFAMSVCLPGGCTRPYSVIWHYVSKDLVSWENLGVVVAPRAGTMDAGDVWAPSVVRVGAEWRMYYTAVVYSGGTPIQRIAVATSTDLSTWTRATDNVVLECDTLSWAYWNLEDANGIGGDCRDPYVFWDAGQNRWAMTVSTRMTTQWGEHPMVIGTAWSEDGIVWHEGVKLSVTVGWTAESSHVVFQDGQYYVFWTKCAANQTCVQWARASSLDATLTAPQNMRGTETWEYASEALMGQGEPLFLTVGAGIHIRRMATLDDAPQVIPLGLSFVSLHTVIEVPDLPASLWPGVFNIHFDLYKNMGDASWNPAEDQLVSTIVSGVHGQLSLKLPPGTYWIVPLASDFAADQPLAPYSPTEYTYSFQTHWDETAALTWTARPAGRDTDA